MQENIHELSELNTFKLEKRQYLPKNQKKGTVVNRALSYLDGGSLEIMLTLTLKQHVCESEIVNLNIFKFEEIT